MKLISLAILTLSLTVKLKAQKYRQDQFPFPPHFQTPGPGLFSSDSSLYLPPESHTSIPYFPVKNVNHLQFPYLPPTGTKAPAIYQPHYPFIYSTTLVPTFDDDDEGEGIIRMSSPPPPPLQPKFNHTEHSSDQMQKEKREMRTHPKMFHQQPIDRIDLKLPPAPLRPIPTPISSTPMPVNQTPGVRRMVMATETHRNDLSLDQVNAASFHGSPFVAAANIPGVYLSSTTEPAIPILRLSNEMDLDGSFSYEALGADQTHYVQHSRMENMGPDKQEQVVEGSYSYVGDNGQTYTVHYIADSNGFRASGDHLPVAPPIPEIIQRSVQYNLAEEAKRPTNQKSWQEDGKDYSISDGGNNNQYVSPPRLFTGRTPEAFSYSYSQGSNTQNNIVTSASTQMPIKAEPKAEPTQNKPISSPISPQVTFLASQGAHVPQMNTVQNTISRMFSNEKTLSSLPKLVNYEAVLKESEQESKPLWRWQYGLNANNLSQNPKDTISRSFGEGDDVIINFRDMSPEQYTHMIRSQIPTNSETTGNNQFLKNDQAHDYQNNYYHNEDQALKNSYRDVTEPIKLEYTTPKETIQTSSEPSITLEDWYKSYNNNYPQFPTTVKPIENRETSMDYKPKIVTHRDFENPTPSHTITQSYDFDESSYEPKRIRALNPINMKYNENKLNVIPLTLNKNTTPFTNLWTEETEIRISTTPEPLINTFMPVSTYSSIRFTDFIANDNNNKFKPIFSSSTTETSVGPSEIPTTSTESSADIIKNNIFLKGLFHSVKPETPQEKATLFNPITPETSQEKSALFNSISPKTLQANNNNVAEEPTEVPKKVFQVKIEAEPKTDKIPKYIQHHTKPVNEIKNYRKKPIDIADILNYVAMKNQFESSKVKSEVKQTSSENFDNRNIVRYIPIPQEKNEEADNKDIEAPKRTFRKEQELRGVFKNYKVLQRNNKNISNNYVSSKELKRELSPPPIESHLPPLGRAGPSMKSYLPPIYV